MYILVAYSDTDITFTLKDESGTLIGEPYVFAFDTYQADLYKQPGFIRIFLATSTIGATLPIFYVPTDRVIFTNTQSAPDFDPAVGT